MDLPRYHTCASPPTCRIYVHPFRNSFGLIELGRLSRDTRLTSDSCSSGWGYRLPPSKSLPFSTCRVASPSPVRADSGLSPHRHTCTAGRTKQTARTLLHVRAVLEIDCSGWVTKSLHGSHPFSVAVRTHASHQQWHASLHPGSCRSCVRRRPRSTWCRSG